MIDINELKALVAEYLPTLNDSDKDEWYATDRDFAEGELGKFIRWIDSGDERDERIL